MRLIPLGLIAIGVSAQTLVFVPQPKAAAEAAFIKLNDVTVWTVQGCVAPGAAGRTVPYARLIQYAIPRVVPVSPTLVLRLLQKEQRESWQARAVRYAQYAAAGAATLLSPGAIAASEQIRYGVTLAALFIPLARDSANRLVPRFGADFKTLSAEDGIQIPTDGCSKEHIIFSRKYAGEVPFNVDMDSPAVSSDSLTPPGVNIYR